MSKVCAILVIRNGNQLGYPWLEAAHCLLPYVDKLLINEGHSDDNTLNWVIRLHNRYPDKVVTMQSLWMRSVTGFAIGQVTNEALDYARVLGCDWLWNLQGDELYHPRVARAVRKLMDDLGPDVEGIELPFLHLQNNYQEVQPGAGYTHAIRAVRNRPHIHAYRDAWTFDGCGKTYRVDERLPVVHANRTYWHNIPKKLRSHADTLYPDLGHYKAAAEQAEKLHDAETVPGLFLATTSPFAHYLPEIILPTVGWLSYQPREELVR